MIKRVFQFALVTAAVCMFVLTPFACQQAAPPEEDAGAGAKPAGEPGKRLMAAKPKAEGAMDEAAEAVEGGAEAVGEAMDEAGEAIEEGAEATGEAMEKGAEAVEEGAEAAGEAMKKAADSGK